MILRYFGLIDGGIKPIVAQTGEFLSIAMIEFPECAEWLMLGGRFKASMKDGAP